MSEKRAAGYIRVSTQEQKENGWNLDADRQRIEAEATDHGWDLIEVYDDGGRQGDDAYRPGFNAMLDDAAARKFDVLVLRSLDRLSRDLELFAKARNVLRRAGVTVVDFNGPVQMYSLESGFRALIAEDEKRKISVQVRQMKAARARAGGHPGGKRPYGYMLAPTGATGKHGKAIMILVPHPAERHVVVRIFEMADAGTSQRQIARILNDEGIPASKGGRWAQSQVARILGSPLYLGKLRSRVGDGWQVYDGQHEAIVDEHLWQRVNRSRAMPERRAGGRPLNSRHLMTRGLLRCSCDSAIIPVASYGGRPETYKCKGRRDHGPGFCNMPSIRRDVVDTALLGELTSRYFDLDATRARLKAQIDSEQPRAKAAVEERLSELRMAESRISRVVRGWQDGVISDDEYRRQRSDLDAEHEASTAALEQAERHLAEIEATTVTTDAEEALLRHLADLKRLVSGTVDQAQDIEALRTVIRTLFDRITLMRWSWDDLDEIQAAGIKAGDLYLVPVPKPGVVDLLPDWRFNINKVPLPEVTTSRCR